MYSISYFLFISKFYIIAADSFLPIGDLCYPSSPSSSSSSSYQVTTKVTPAYPGKIKCSSAIPYEVCVNILKGQMDEEGLRKLSLATANDARLTENGLLRSTSLSSTSNSFDNSVSNVDSTIFGRYNSLNNLGRYTSNNMALNNGFAAYEKPYTDIRTGSPNFGVNGFNKYKTYENSFGTSSSSLDAFQKSAINHRYDCGSTNDFDIGMFLDTILKLK